MVGIENSINNFFAFNTKREVVNQVNHTDAFKDCYADTISCSHPCLSRYNKNGEKEYPINCGYCYPCLIRKSSVLDVERDTKYSFAGETYKFLIANKENDKGSDLRAVLSSIYRYKHIPEEDLKRFIRSVGRLSPDEVEKFLRVYKSSMEDLIELFAEDEIMRYLGI